MQEKRKKVLICPLDWGLGHATRCIPLIRALNEAGAEVIVASSGKPALLLAEEFPQLKHLHLPGATIQYGANGFSFLKMFFQLPELLLSVWKEHKAVNKIIKANQIDIIISDNRYGLWSEKCYSVFITHQLNIKLPAALALFQKSVNNFALYFIRKFNACIVPDTEQHLLAGELSSSTDKKLQFIYAGPLSRFKKSSNHQSLKQYDVLVILSGPEPQRSFLEKKLMDELKDKKYTVLLIRGMPDEMISYPDTIDAMDHLSTDELNYHLLNAKYIICRSGYSSLMDLAATGRSAIIIPTPGQTEQEYLAELHHLKHHYALRQNDLQLETAMQKVNSLQPLDVQSDMKELVFTFMQPLRTPN